MDFSWLTDLFVTHSVVNTVVILAAVIAVGVMIGKINFFGISFGIGGVMFAGLFFGHLHLGVGNHEVLHFIREFGLILFVYTVGIEIGPAFFASFKRHGLRLNLLAGSIILLGFAIAIVIFLVTGLPIATVVGIMSGAVTNTPGLGAAQQALSEIPNQAENLDLPGLGYAMTYPFGILGVILTMLAVKKGFGIRLKQEQDKFKQLEDEFAPKPSAHSLIVTNSRFAGSTLGKLRELVQEDFVISRILRNDEHLVPKTDTVFEQGDIVTAVCDAAVLEDLALMLGDFSEIKPALEVSGFELRSVEVTAPESVGKRIGELDFQNRFGVSVTRINRAGMEFAAAMGIRLRFGDTAVMVGGGDGLDKATVALGGERRRLEHANIAPIFLGVVMGLIVGAIPIHIPGVPTPLRLGLAGGPLLVALILGRIRQIGPVSWYMHPGANRAVREIGIAMFLAVVGLTAGGRFIETITDGDGFYWMALGAVITLVPLMLVASVARLIFKENYLSICGLVSGSMTDPPALSFATQAGGSNAPALVFATVYALALFMRVICAQLLVILFA